MIADNRVLMYVNTMGNYTLTHKTAKVPAIE